MQVMKLSKLRAIPAWRWVLAGLYAGFAVVLLAYVRNFAVFLTMKPDYIDPGRNQSAIVPILLLIIAIVTQIWMAVAIVRGLRMVRVVSRFDLLAGAMRTFLVIGFGWVYLRQILPVHFFKNDVCACMPGQVTPYVPLDPYRDVIVISALAIAYIVLGILPLWFFNRSKLAKETFVK